MSEPRRPRPTPQRRSRVERRRHERLAVRRASARYWQPALAGVLAAGVGFAVLFGVHGGSGAAPSRPAGPTVTVPTGVPEPATTLPTTLPISPAGTDVPLPGATDEAVTESTTGAVAFADPVRVGAVLSAARSAVTAVDSYDYRHLATDRAAGERAATASFRSSYRNAMHYVARRAAAHRLVQTCTVERVGISSLSATGTRAGVLVFARLRSRARNAAPNATEVALGVTVARVAGSWRISAVQDLRSNGSFVADPPGTASLRAAATAGGAEVLRLLNYRRSDFAAGYDRALAGLGGPLRTQQQARRSSVSAAMTAGGFDYAGQVRAIAVEGVTDHSATLLVTATGYRVDDHGTRSGSTTLRLELDETSSGGSWLVDRFATLSGA